MSRRPLRLTILVTALLALPQVSFSSTPGNGWIVWASNRAGVNHDIYLMKSDGTGVTRLTTTGARMATWSPDGRWIAYETAPGGRARVMRWDKSEDHEVFAGTPLFWMHDGSGLVCRTGDQFKLVDPDSGTVSHLFSKSDFAQVASSVINPGGITHDGRFLVTHTDRYRAGYTGTNGAFKAYHAAAILDLNDKSLLYFFGDGCEPTTPPSGGVIYHVCGNGPCSATKPDPYKMQIADRMSRSSYSAEIAHADADWGHEYFPRISTDGVWMTYAATTGCHNHDTCPYEIFVHRLGAGNADRTRLTDDSTNDQWPHMYVGDLWQPAVPVLALTPAGLTFSAAQAQNPASQEITVTNSGLGTLDPVTTSVAYGSGSGWLTVTRLGSGNDQRLSNAVDVSGLAAGTHAATVTVSASNASGSKAYQVSLTVAESLRLAELRVSATPARCAPGEAVNVTATALDQFGAPFAAGIGWTSSGGGTLSPASSGGGVTGHTTVFTSDGSEGAFQVTATSGAVSGSATITVAAPPSLPLRINCGSNDYPVEGWLQDDPFVTGGQDWVNSSEVDTAGVESAGPPQLYKSVRHRSPHEYLLPVPNGRYILRIHFADAYTDRAMDYFVEGVQILSAFDVSSEAGGSNRALVKDFEVEVSDGNGMLIEAVSDGDVFEAGIEVFVAPDTGGDGGVGADGGSSDDGGSTSPDAGDQPATDAGATAPDGGSDPDETDLVLGGGCGCSSRSPGSAASALLLILGLWAFGRRRPGRSGGARGLLLMAALLLPLSASAEDAKPTEVVAELVEIPGEMPPDDLYDYAFVMKYKVKGGPMDGRILLVAHYKPRVARKKLDQSMRALVGGNLKRFKEGDVHRLVLLPDLEKVWSGAVVDEYFASDRKTPRWWCRQADAD